MWEAPGNHVGMLRLKMVRGNYELLIPVELGREGTQNSTRFFRAARPGSVEARASGKSSLTARSL